MREKVLIAGGTGLVGSRLVELLDKDRYEIHILSRSRSHHPEIIYHRWDISEGKIDEEAVRVDHIINLAGAGIADKPWTKERRKVIIDSRVESTKLLQSAILSTRHTPKTYITASAIGYYGDRGEEILSETSQPGSGFMSECCILWEESSESFLEIVERRVVFRVGIVLSSIGGALPKVMMTKGMGVFSYFGSGRQYYSWIHIDDVARCFIEALSNKKYHGIYNAVSPHPITNKQFTAHVMKGADTRGLLIPAPAFALKIMMGKMSDVILNSNRVIPMKLEQEGFDFQFENLEEAVKDCIARKV